MYELLNCITDRHDWRLLLLAGAVALATSVAGIALYAYAATRERPVRYLWLGVAGATAGTGAWSTHFVALLGFKTPTAAYEPVLTLLSWAIAVAGFALVLIIASQRRTTVGRAMSGALLGPVVAGLHYVGIHAMAVEGTFAFRPDWTLISIAAGALLGAGAMVMIGDTRRWGRNLSGAALMASGVVALHTSGMTGTLVTAAVREVPPMLMSATALASFVGVVAAVLVLSGLAAALVAGRIDRDALALLRDAAGELSDALTQAESANRAKDTFLANMSHELRTPLNGVLAITEALGKTQLSPHQRELIADIQHSGQALAVVLSDILDLARFASGTAVGHAERVMPRLLAEEVADAWYAAATDKGLTLSCVAEPEAEADIACDRQALRQILDRLLGNAVKFTQAGGIALRLARDGEALTFEVEDSGIGFLPEQARVIFERFRQGDESVSRRFGGSGLGLSIARELAVAMGGQLTAEGRSGKGARFTLTLPAPTLAPAAIPVLVNEAVSIDQGRMVRVLLAEDHPINRKVVSLILASIEAELTSVETGEEAVEAFLSGAFDVVLMDMQMPVMDGLSATRAIRAHERALALVPTPVLMLTANALPEHVAQAAAAGCDRHIAKPVSAAGLLDAIGQALDIAAEQAQARSA